MVRRRIFGLRSPGWPWRARCGNLVLLCIMVLAGGGCGTDVKPMAFPGDPENPTGPGVLTGEAGEWVILRPTREEQLENDVDQRDAE